MAHEVNTKLVHIALNDVPGSVFESFANALYPSIAGEGFVPLGGTHDGGADAFLSSISEGSETGTFYQASVEADHRSKIRRTVKRLREFGREPKTLIYLTSRVIKLIDRQEKELGDELGITVRIRDAKYLESHVNDDVSTRAAFRTHLEPQLAFLNQLAPPGVLVPQPEGTSTAVYVFLSQELDRHEGKDGLVNALTDGMILWALESTNPDENLLMTRSQIEATIAAELPAALKVIKGALPTRLNHLSTVLRRGARPVRAYKKQGKYCLAHELREEVAGDNAKDEALRISVRESFQQRAADRVEPEDDPTAPEVVADIAIRAVQKTFEQEGIEFSAFLVGELKEPTANTVADHVDSCLDDSQVDGDLRLRTKELAISVLRGAFYESTQDERLYFSRLAETYTLLFCLNSEPKVVEYFQSMSADFFLYVGTDILVRSLSERYLLPEDQMTRNTLRLIRDAGGRLILTDPVLDEVYSHIGATDYEFQNHYLPHESSITPIIASNSDRILIRAYFYAKHSPPDGLASPSSWVSYVEQFCDYGELHSPSGREQIKRYLMAEFGLDFESRDELESLCDPTEVAQLSDRLQVEKSDSRLAENDALMALAVYGRRRARKETTRISEFGYRTWWLTSESTIRRHTKELVEGHGARYIMRPEFILNFLTLAPSGAEVKKTFRAIFPSLLGLKLGRRVPQGQLRRVLREVAKAQELDDGRRQAKVSAISDKLKSDFYKKYEHNF